MYASDDSRSVFFRLRTCRLRDQTRESLGRAEALVADARAARRTIARDRLASSERRAMRLVGGSDGTSHREIMLAVRSKLRDGRLPAGRPRETWGGPGSGQPCSACEHALRPTEPEVEVHVQEHQSPQVLHLHGICFQIWLRATDTVNGSSSDIDASRYGPRADRGPA